MRFSSRLPVATHILLCIALLGEEHKTTSTFLAGSVGVNPVIVRNVLGQLKAAGLVAVEPGVGGASLTMEPEEITLRDVLEAVEDDTGVFHMHEHPSPECPIGRNVHAVLGAELEAAETAMLERLASTTLADLADETRELIQQQEQG
ncbi:transcriptional regulator [Gordonibacter sp. An230]|uniref:Rrf2 family transcriptional regulator n=1 Tax=Gordonibacter sp. An230 TaxID=1965592 RepID=UPI000B3A1F5D|nr:Rrf2 family transcriptional regulator [Gordonibacter sp. An230]OUO89939.1 transcriptional regulator [Gordonibacter sp. An230]